MRKYKLPGNRLKWWWHHWPPRQAWNRSSLGRRGLWEWLSLLLVPLALALVAFMFEEQRDARDREIADDRATAERESSDARATSEREVADGRATVDHVAGQDRLQQAALERYLDRMTSLLTGQDLRHSDQGNETRSIARAETLTTLRILDGERKGVVIQFLYETGLITGTLPVIRLKGADLGGAEMEEADLRGADLSKAYLAGAVLRGAAMDEIRLDGADLRGADLSGASLTLSSLRGVNLDDSLLHNTNLYSATLVGARLGSAYLKDAWLYGADFNGADLSRARMWGALVNETTMIPDYPISDWGKITEWDPPLPPFWVTAADGYPEPQPYPAPQDPASYPGP